MHTENPFVTSALIAGDNTRQIDGFTMYCPLPSGLKQKHWVKSAFPYGGLCWRARTLLFCWISGMRDEYNNKETFNIFSEAPHDLWSSLLRNKFSSLLAGIRDVRTRTQWVQQPSLISLTLPWNTLRFFLSTSRSLFHPPSFPVSLSVYTHLNSGTRHDPHSQQSPPLTSRSSHHHTQPSPSQMGAPKNKKERMPQLLRVPPV